MSEILTLDKIYLKDGQQISFNIDNIYYKDHDNVVPLSKIIQQLLNKSSLISTPISYQENIDELEKQNQILNQKIDDINKILVKNQLALPSWQDVTDEQLTDILDDYYNGNINIEDIPWEIGDQKIIPCNFLISNVDPMYSNSYGTPPQVTCRCTEVILTILDKEKQTLQYETTARTKAAFVIGINVKGSVTSTYNSLTANGLLSLYCRSSNNMYQVHYNDLYMPKYSFDTSQTDSATINIVTRFFNQIIPDWIGTWGKQVYFDELEQYRTFIPPIQSCFDWRNNPLCYQYFKDNKNDPNKILQLFKAAQRWNNPEAFAIIPSGNSSQPLGVEYSNGICFIDQAYYSNEGQPATLMVFNI